MYNTRGVMKQVTFKETVCSNILNKTCEGDSEIITIKEEVKKKTIEIRIKKRQILPDRKIIKLIT